MRKILIILLGISLFYSCGTKRRPRNFVPPRERPQMDVRACAQELHRSLNRQRAALLRKIPNLSPQVRQVLLVPTLRFKRGIERYEYYNKFRRQPYFHSWEELFGLLDMESFCGVQAFIEEGDGHWYTCMLESFDRRVVPIDSMLYDAKYRPFLETLLSRGAPLTFRLVFSGRYSYSLQDGQLEAYDFFHGRIRQPSEVLPVVVKAYSEDPPYILRGSDYEHDRAAGNRRIKALKKILREVPNP